MDWKIIILLLLGFASCTADGEETEFQSDQKAENEIKSSPEEIIVRQIENNLQIPATEKYSYKIYREELNGDDSLDYVITVNRLDFALDEAIKSDNVAKRAELGYIGRYNFIFYMDGKSKDITPAIPVASSPHAELKVSFENIRTEAYKDIMVDYRIRNSDFRRFFSVVDKIPHQTFETKIFDGLGTNKTEAYDIRFEPGSYSLSKDIVVYKAILENVTIDDPMEIYSIDPKITPTEEVDRKWFFHEAQQKYFTRTE